MAFRGGPVLTLDSKGRVTVPARWREALVEDAAVKGVLVCAKDAAGCLALYPLPVWEGYEAQLRELPAEHDAWRRFLIGSATEVEIDSASRVLVPPELRSWAGLEEGKGVKFMGVGSYFELWDQARFEAHEAATLAQGRPAALLQMVVR